MHDLLSECTENFGVAPRHISLWDRLTYLRIAKPHWLREDPSDKMLTYFENFSEVFTEGVVVWGHVIQANRILFEDGPDNAPGEVVYSLHDSAQATPEHLRRVAYSLGLLKHTEPENPELAPIAEYLTNQRIRVFGLRVPIKISRRVRCRISTTYFVRKHLPNRRLCSPLLPLVVNPRAPFVAVILPERYWPEEFAEWWTQSAVELK